MTLGYLIKDIYSKLEYYNINVNDVFYYDVVKIVNDTIRKLRSEFISDGKGEQFAITEILYFTIPSLEYPFLRETELEYEPIKEVPISSAIVSAYADIGTTPIVNAVSSSTKGIIASKGGKQYKCVESYSGINTYDLTFDGVLRNYSFNNGLTYKETNVLRIGSSYYKVLTDFTNTYTDTTTMINEGLIVKVYWMYVGSSYVMGVFYSFERLNEMRLFSDYEMNSIVFSVNKNKVFVPLSTKQLTLTYVPKWIDVEDPDDELEIPDIIVQGIKQTVLQELSIKLGSNEQNTGNSQG